MPLLRGKPFRRKTQPDGLEKDDEVFFFELTNEVFTDYDEFFERVILCNSLLWTCECTGRNGLTYKEATESEDNVKQALSAIPDPTKRAVLVLVHQTKRSRLADLCEEIMDYLKTHFQEEEIVEVKLKHQWKKAKVVKVHEKRSPKKKTPKKNESENNDHNTSPSTGRDTMSSEDIVYEVKIDKMDGSEAPTFQGKDIRRGKGILTKDLLRLWIRQTCKRTTLASDDGYWVVQSEYVEKFSLGPANLQSGPLSPETPLKVKNKRKRSSGKLGKGEISASPSKKRKSSVGSLEKSPDGKKLKKLKDTESGEKKSKSDKLAKQEQKMKDMTPTQKKKFLEKQKLKEQAKKEKLKKKKMLVREQERERLKKEKEEEKQKRKVEKEKEKVRTTAIRKFEAEFLKGWTKIRDDLKLEDLKELPETKPLQTKFQDDLFGDTVMVVEFLNTFGTFYDMNESLQQDVTYDFIESALLEHDAEGAFYEVVKFLLQTYFAVSKEESEQVEGEDESSNGTTTPDEPDADQEQIEEHEHGHVSSNATAAAAWSMLHQGMALDELTIDPFTLSEVLRLHILSSGVKIGGARSMWQTKGGFQFSDDPCVDFRHHEKSILTTLHTNCLYDLPVSDKLKILCVLCNQILTLTTTRDYIEDSFEKVKELKKKLRELQNTEHKRRKLESAEKWRRKMEESAKKKEEMEKKRKEKESRENEGKKEETEPNPGDDSTSSKKKKRKSKNDERNTEPTASEPQESKNDDDADMVAVLEKKKEDEAQGEKEELCKREEFKKQEQELLEEIAECSSVRSVAPLGLDRIYSRYWAFRHINGLFVESDDAAKHLVDYIVEEYDDESSQFTAEDSQTKDDNESLADQEQESKVEFPNVTISDIIDMRNSGKPICDMLFNKYRCKLGSERQNLINDSKIISLALENVENGIDPHIYARKRTSLWSAYSDEILLDNLINNLNPRGIREVKLKTKLEKLAQKLRHSIGNCALLGTSDNKKIVQVKPVKGEINKALFKTIEDFLEANLRDQLLDFEERLWQGSLGIIKVENRDEWREDIGSKINDLLLADEKPFTEGDRENFKIDSVNGIKIEQPEKMQVDGKADEKPGKLENGHCEGNDERNDDKMDVDDDDQIKSKKDDSISSELGSIPFDSSDLPSRKSLPLKFIEQNHPEKGDSRCSTPVNIATPTINPRVRILAAVLQKIERGIDPKYLKPPLGEDEQTKRERIREMIEAAHADFNVKNEKPKREGKKKMGKSDSNGNEDEKVDADDDKKSVASEAVSEESLRREITSLERWETSLNTATNFSQIFIHLNTLDRSVMWDKSVLNARCRTCRKKGDAERMLLCDGCDRGFHMYCLKPPVKKIPEGDWFCVDCRPKEPKRTPRARKRPTKLEEFVDDIEEDQETEELNENEESNESEEEESEEEESADDETVDEHEDFCAVCEVHGDLLCCDSCTRAFHVNCVYPPIRKVPRGNWSCQVCTGSDLDLPKARRVHTKEREREKRQKLESKKENTKGKKPGGENKERKRHSLQGPTGSKRQALSSGKSDEPKQQKGSSRRSIGDPTSIRSRRNTDGFGRYERRLCSKITEELISAEDGEPFILPVDTKVVSDYLDFIDNPMDLSTVKQKLNKGSYDTLQQFVNDVRLIFTNCETYNPPRSSVARASSRLSIYFEQRLRELELVGM